MEKSDSKNNIVEPEKIVEDGASSAEKEIAIQTIPDKFYGAALRATISEKKEPKPEKEEGSSSFFSGKLPMILAGVVVFLCIAGGVLYVNRDVLFSDPQHIATEPVVQIPEPEPEPEPIPVPLQPMDLSAKATSPTVVQLFWTDISDNETGFRIERKDPESDYHSITNLSRNSTAFQDTTVSQKTSYVYRIFAVNESGDSPSSAQIPVETPEEPPPAPESPKLPPAGLDSDSDGLSDLEEPIFGSKPLEQDTDRDTFLDGNEVFHLYNPSAGTSVRLEESGIAKPLESPVGWSFIIPSVWRSTMSNDGTSVTVSSDHGEAFTLSIESNVSGQGIMDWYLAGHPGVLSSDVSLVTTKSGIEGIVGIDPLVTYFPWGSYIVVFSYQLNDQPFVNFRTTYEMMKNSLHLESVPNLSSPVQSVVGRVIPETVSQDQAQVVPVTEESATTSSTSDQVEGILPSEQPVSNEETGMPEEGTDGLVPSPEAEQTPPEET